MQNERISHLHQLHRVVQHHELPINIAHILDSGRTRFGVRWVISTGDPTPSSYQRSYPEACNPFLSRSMTKLRPDYFDSPAFVLPHLEITTTYHSMPMSSSSSTIAPVSSRAPGRSRWSCLRWPSMFSSSPTPCSCSTAWE